MVFLLLLVSISQKAGIATTIILVVVPLAITYIQNSISYTVRSMGPDDFFQVFNGSRGQRTIQSNEVTWCKKNKTTNEPVVRIFADILQGSINEKIKDCKEPSDSSYQRHFLFDYYSS